MKDLLLKTGSVSIDRIKMTILVLSVFVLMSFQFNAGGGFEVIVNDANPVASMTASQIKITYLRKLSRRWKELSKNILPVDRSGSAEVKNLFLNEVLKMTSPELDKYFSEREYQNQEPAPVKFSSDEEVIKYVSENPGAIGYVSSSANLDNSKVKVIFKIEK